MGVNDTWGAWPAPEPEQKPAAEPRPLGEWTGGVSWPAPAGSDAWQTSPPLPPSDAVPLLHDDGSLAGFYKPEYVEGPDAWPVEPSHAGVQTAHDEFDTTKDIADVLRDGGFTVAFDTGEMTVTQRVSFVNTLNNEETAYSVERDGELREMEPQAADDDVSYYICYRHSAVLFAVLAGPYDSEQKAGDASLKAFQLMSNDDAYKVAFENKFHSMGLYIGEIPTKAKRKGAYGAI